MEDWHPPLIQIKIDEHCTEPKITIVTNKVTEEINEIMKKLAGEQTQMIAGFQFEKIQKSRNIIGTEARIGQDSQKKCRDIQKNKKSGKK